MESDRVDYLVRELFAPINASLDYIFAAGVLYGATHLAGFAWSCLKGIRTYFVPFGRSIRRDLTEEFGKWAGTYACSPAHVRKILTDFTNYLFTQ